MSKPILILTLQTNSLLAAVLPFEIHSFIIICFITADPLLTCIGNRRNQTAWQKKQRPESRRKGKE